MPKAEPIAFLRRRFAHYVCPALGYSAEGTPNTPGHAYIERASAPGHYRAIVITNPRGGAADLSDSLSRADLMAWMDGVLFASDHFGKRSHIAATIQHAPTHD